MSEDKLYKIAERRADEKIAFKKHLRSFIFVNLVLFMVNALTSWGHWSWDSWWFYWITLFWGIGLIVHFLKVYVLNNKFDDEDYREQMIQKEMEKLKK